MAEDSHAPALVIYVEGSLLAVPLFDGEPLPPVGGASANTDVAEGLYAVLRETDEHYEVETMGKRQVRHSQTTLVPRNPSRGKITRYLKV